MQLVLFPKRRELLSATTCDIKKTIWLHFFSKTRVGLLVFDAKNPTRIVKFLCFERINWIFPARMKAL
jgi:hypothetical protein